MAIALALTVALIAWCVVVAWIIQTLPLWLGSVFVFVLFASIPRGIIATAENELRKKQ